jgi:phenylacetate-CoA ligase
VGPNDRAFFAFSFGPFLGFWTAFEAAAQIGVHVVPGGGMSSEQRLDVIDAIGATVVCCTPTYALRLAEVAAERGGARMLADGPVRVLIVAGEAGGSIPATRERIERAWGARVIDHHGLTEVGPISFACWSAEGFLHVIEDAYLCEVIDPATLRAVADGEVGELVITTLKRSASPVIRYRTGDLVRRRREPCVCGRTWARLEGGILARADDMITVRGVNIYPTAIESIVRAFEEIVEFRARVSDSGAMRSLSVEIEVAMSASEAPPRLAQQVSDRLRTGLGLTVPVLIVERGALPRFDMKARRVVIE